MTIKHTPEPWQVHQDASGDVFISSAETSFHIAEIGSEDDEAVIPDARRIAACVNACRGLPTEELEQKGLVAAVGTQLLEADQLRDELLAALAEIDACFEAALIEGWNEAMAEDDMSRIKDIYCRRIDSARSIAVAALSGGVV